MIEQVLINLVINAKDAFGNKTNDYCNILVNHCGKVNHIIIQVIDNGKDINENELENIFIPFYTTKKDGSGIGLSLSRQIMKLHNGSITVKSVCGEGAEFLLKF
jgi:two-component system, NtrC family, nitrogen regulation sensor histidine kinase NtrY